MIYRVIDFSNFIILIKTTKDVIQLSFCDAPSFVPPLNCAALLPLITGIMTFNGRRYKTVQWKMLLDLLKKDLVV